VAYDLSKMLVIGISSRALFDLQYEHEIYSSPKGLPAFLEYQRHHEEDVLNRGTGFHLVQSLLKLNRPGEDRRVEVIVMSRNHPDVYLRVSNSIRHYGLDISRAMLNGGEPLDRLLRAYKFDLFLSASEEDVGSALRCGVAAGRIYSPPGAEPPPSDQIRVAFDGDCVLFSDEAEKVYSGGGLKAFHEHERLKAKIPLPDGPFAKLLRTIAQMQGPDPDKSPFRIGLVTARNAPANERALRTLRDWNVRIDYAAFLGGLAKDPWLVAFQPQIFFDDQEGHCSGAAQLVPTAQVPFPFEEPATPAETITIEVTTDRRNQFLLVCKGYLKGGAAKNQSSLQEWYSANLADCDDAVARSFLAELMESVAQTPVGKERPAKGEDQSKQTKFVSFLDTLMQKHRSVPRNA
jgi:5'-nucleotidase